MGEDAPDPDPPPDAAHAAPAEAPAPRALLRRGWTTGACAAAAARAAFTALHGGGFPDPVVVPLPGGQRPAFALAEGWLEDGAAVAGVVKDAGDDPDVTHGALVRVRVWPGTEGGAGHGAGAAREGIAFRAGEGVGTVTRPGLPLPPGEPAINPGPRGMIAAAIGEAARALGVAAAAVVEVSVPGGERLAERTLNARLGVLGGLSILGTTGVVVPYSCAAWIDAVRRGIDVARASGIEHVAGSTGSTSERAAQRLHGLPEVALIEMGDFAGGMLKYLRRHPVPRVTVAGGVAKMTKLAQGRLDLHSRRGAVDLAGLGEMARLAGGRRVARGGDRGMQHGGRGVRAGGSGRGAARGPGGGARLGHRSRGAGRQRRATGGAAGGPRGGGGRAGGVPGGRLKEASASFLKKRSKKLLFPEHRTRGIIGAKPAKVFLLLFLQKKKTLACFLPNPAHTPSGGTGRKRRWWAGS